MNQINKIYIPQYNYQLAMLPKAYREVSTFKQWYREEMAKRLSSMKVNDLSS